MDAHNLDSLLLQTELLTMAKNLRIPLGHGSPSVNQVSKTPGPGLRCTCVGASGRLTAKHASRVLSPPPLCLGLELLHCHTFRHVPASFQL